MIPVLYELDVNEEACYVHFFCCVGCRSQSHYKDPGRNNEGEAHPNHVLDGTQCETCGRVVDHGSVQNDVVVSRDGS